jgi:hypothetical protein
MRNTGTVGWTGIRIGPRETNQSTNPTQFGNIEEARKFVFDKLQEIGSKIFGNEFPKEVNPDVEKDIKTLFAGGGLPLTPVGAALYNTLLNELQKSGNLPDVLSEQLGPLGYSREDIELYLVNAVGPGAIEEEPLQSPYPSYAHTPPTAEPQQIPSYRGTVPATGGTTPQPTFPTSGPRVSYGAPTHRVPLSPETTQAINLLTDPNLNGTMSLKGLYDAIGEANIPILSFSSPNNSNVAIRKEGRIDWIDTIRFLLSPSVIMQRTQEKTQTPKIIEDTAGAIQHILNQENNPSLKDPLYKGLIDPKVADGKTRIWFLFYNNTFKSGTKEAKSYEPAYNLMREINSTLHSAIVLSKNSGRPAVIYRVVEDTRDPKKPQYFLMPLVLTKDEKTGNLYYAPIFIQSQKTSNQKQQQTIVAPFSIFVGNDQNNYLDFLIGNIYTIQTTGRGLSVRKVEDQSITTFHPGSNLRSRLEQVAQKLNGVVPWPFYAHIE